MFGIGKKDKKAKLAETSPNKSKPGEASPNVVINPLFRHNIPLRSSDPKEVLSSTKAQKSDPFAPREGWTGFNKRATIDVPTKHSTNYLNRKRNSLPGDAQTIPAPELTKKVRIKDW